MQVQKDLTNSGPNPGTGCSSEAPMHQVSLLRMLIRPFRCWRASPDAWRYESLPQTHPFPTLLSNRFRLHPRNCSPWTLKALSHLSPQPSESICYGWYLGHLAKSRNRFSRKLFQHHNNHCKQLTSTNQQFSHARHSYRQRSQKMDKFRNPIIPYHFNAQPLRLQIDERLSHQPSH